MRHSRDTRPPRPPAAAPVKPASPPPKPVPPPPPAEPGWLPDYVYTGEKFEAGLAFFADALGRVTRFSREPKDLAAARRLSGQAALPGLVNTHATSWQRVLRGRGEHAARPGVDAVTGWNEFVGRLRPRLAAGDVFEASRMAFTEMLLSGITCVGEFQDLTPAVGDEPLAIHDAVLAAAHEVGIRISLFPVARMRTPPGGVLDGGEAALPASVDDVLRGLEQLRTAIAARYAADEAWLGVAPAGLGAVPLEAFKVLANYAHTQRLRLQTRVAESSAAVSACTAEHGRPAVVVLAEHGVVDKRFTAVHGIALSDEECRLLGTARAHVVACPTTEHDLALGVAPVAKLLAAGAGLALGTGAGFQVDLLKEARLLEYALRTRTNVRPAIAGDAVKALFHAATVTGARSLGATGGALEVGRPADFFTVNLHEPSIAGSDPDALLANIVLALERRSIREVWIGARQRVANGRHVNHGLIVGRFVELQRRLWQT